MRRKAAALSSADSETAKEADTSRTLYTNVRWSLRPGSVRAGPEPRSKLRRCRTARPGPDRPVRGRAILGGTVCHGHDDLVSNHAFFITMLPGARTAPGLGGAAPHPKMPASESPTRRWNASSLGRDGVECTDSDTFYPNLTHRHPAAPTATAAWRRDPFCHFFGKTLTKPDGRRPSLQS